MNYQAGWHLAFLTVGLNTLWTFSQVTAEFPRTPFVGNPVNRGNRAVTFLGRRFSSFGWLGGGWQLGGLVGKVAYDARRSRTKQ